MAALLDIVKKNATSRSVTIRIIDSTDGTPETGVVFNTAGIDLWYRREDAAVVSITEADLTTPALTDTWETGGFLHISDGEYRLDVPNAAFVTAANHVDIGGTVTGMVVIGGRVRLVDYDPEDAASFKATGFSTHDAAAVKTAMETDGTKLDHLWEMTENDGGTRRLTTNALEQGPDSDTTTGLTLHSDYDAAKTAAQAGNAMALTSGERTTLAAAIEAAIINEVDGNAVMQAIADLIADDMTTGDLSVVAIATAVRDAILDRVLAGNHDSAGTPGKALQDVNTVVPDAAGVVATALGALETHGDSTWATATGGDATEAKQDTIISTLATVAKTGDDSDTLETLSDQLDGLEALSGEGAYTGTLTVDDGSTGLQGVVVNARRGGVLKASGTTDASGEITNWVFGAFTYDLAARLAGYEPETDTIAVSADAWAKTISLTINTISAPPNASTTTGVMTVYDEEGSVEESVEVSVQITDGPGTDGIGYDSTVWTETSSALGVVEFAGIILGARYKIWRGDSKPNAQTFTAPTSGDSFDLAEVIGRG